MQNNTKLGSSIAVMNAKGGVGKSTVTLALAETLSYYYGKKVLIIDSDAQMSISVMLMPFDKLNGKRSQWKTLVGLLHKTLILEETPDWKTFITQNVSDVDDTDSIDLLPGDLRLTLIERAVTEADRHEQMRGLVRSLLAEARLNYDYILIDCPPGLSLLTEIWLREADYHLAPVKPDFLAIAGLEMFREFKKINPDMKMAENLGILINMKNIQSAEDENYHNILAHDEESRCFPEAIPHMSPIQNAARFNLESRSYAAKYPGSAGDAFRNTTHEILQRTGDASLDLVEGVSRPIYATTAASAQAQSEGTGGTAGVPEQPAPISGAKDVKMAASATSPSASKFTTAASKGASDMASRFAPAPEQPADVPPEFLVQEMETHAVAPEASLASSPRVTAASQSAQLPEPPNFELGNSGPVLNVPTLES